MGCAGPGCGKGVRGQSGAMEMPAAGPRTLGRIARAATASWGAFALSLAIHSAVLLLVGGYVVYQGVVPKAPFVSVDTPLVEAAESEVLPEPEEAAGMPDAPQLPAESALTAEASPLEPTEASHDLIVSSASNPLFTLPPAAGGPVAVVGLGSGLGGGTRAGGMGGGNGQAAAAVKQLFGARVEARRLGVIVDGFQSMGPYMPEVLAELERQFPEATVFFMWGCGLEAPATTAVPVRLSLDNWQTTYFGEQKSKVLNTESRWIRSLMAQGRAFAFDKAGSPHRDTIAAFETMIGEGVDTIYWFADFTDNYRPEVVEDLAKRLRQKGIRVHLHHPAGLVDNFAASGYAANADLADRARRGIGILQKHFVGRLPAGSGMIPKVLIRSGAKP